MLQVSNAFPRAELTMNIASLPSANVQHDDDVELSSSAMQPDVVDKSKVAVLRSHKVTPVRIDVAPGAGRAATERAKRRKTYRPTAIMVDKCAVSRAGISSMLACNGYKLAMLCANLDDLKPGQLAKSLADPNPP
jgi:hypothetical protein